MGHTCTPTMRAVDYLRVSTEEQAKGYGITYTGKRTAKYIEKKGWTHVDTYADEVSGSLEAHERPDLKRLMEDARRTPRPFDMVQTVRLLEDTKLWQQEAEHAIQRGRDLQGLAQMARHRLHGMDASQQAEALDLLEIQVIIKGEIPRKTRSDDRISAWFRERGRSVPVLTDKAWARVESIFAARKGRRPKAPRAMLDAMLQKARTGCAWSDLPFPLGSLASSWDRWLTAGLWEQLMDELADMPGDLLPEDGVTLPPIEVRGRVDPRLFLCLDSSRDNDDVFKASDYKISPFELESALLEHEAVAEAAVVPAPDPLRLAVPKAYIVLADGWEPGPETAKAIFAHSRETLAPYKRIRRIEFAELPKTVSGKIRRIELRQRTAEQSNAEQSTAGENTAEYREGDHS